MALTETSCSWSNKPCQSIDWLGNLIRNTSWRTVCCSPIFRPLVRLPTPALFYRLQEAYRWPGQQNDVYQCLRRCARCTVHKVQRHYPPPTNMPVAPYPGQIVGMDLCGTFTLSPYGNRYILTLIDHCTGWAEAHTIPGKDSKHILRYLEQQYLPRYGPPEVIITDQGAEFNALVLRQFMEEMGMEHRRTTLYHPETNGKIERFHWTIKQVFRKLVNNHAPDWEDRLGQALWAHRISTSSVTGFTAFFIQYGRRPRAPLTRILGRTEGSDPRAIGERLDQLGRAFQEAAQSTEESRRYNTKRLEARGKAKDLHPGDLVVVLANERAPLDSRWDHPYLVTRVQGPVVTMLNEATGKMRTVNREKLQLIDPDALWDKERPRVTRAGRKRLLVRGPINRFAPETRTPTMEDVGEDAGGAANPGINTEVPPLPPIPHLPSPLSGNEAMYCSCLFILLLVLRCGADLFTEDGVLI